MDPAGHSPGNLERRALAAAAKPYPQANDQQDEPELFSAAGSTADNELNQPFSGPPKTALRPAGDGTTGVARYDDYLARISASTVYSRDYYHIERTREPLFKLDTEFVLSHVSRDKEVLDAMMGRGRHVLALAREGYRVCGNDFNPEMVSAAGDLLRAAGLNAPLSNFDVRRLGYPSDRFDVVLCLFGSLGMIPSREARIEALTEFARVLKPGGQLILHAHNRWGNLVRPSLYLWTLKTYLNRPPGLAVGDAEYHQDGIGEMIQHIYSPAELTKDLAKAGLSVEQRLFLTPDQDGWCKGLFKAVRSGGMIYVARK